MRASLVGDQSRLSSSPQAESSPEAPLAEWRQCQLRRLSATLQYCRRGNEVRGRSRKERIDPEKKSKYVAATWDRQISEGLA